MNINDYPAKKVELTYTVNNDQQAEEIIAILNAYYPRYIMYRVYDYATKTPTYDFNITVANEKALLLIDMLKELEVKYK